MYVCMYVCVWYVSFAMHMSNRSRDTAMLFSPLGVCTNPPPLSHPFYSHHKSMGVCTNPPPRSHPFYSHHKSMGVCTNPPPPLPTLSTHTINKCISMRQIKFLHSDHILCYTSVIRITHQQIIHSLSCDPISKDCIPRSWLHL